MADPARRTRTFEELYREIQRLPEGLTGEILEEGVLRTMSRPGKRHRLAAVACLDALRGANANLRGSGWWIEVELPLYARSQIPWSWLVDPVLRFVEVYQTVNGYPTLVASAQEDEQRVLPPFELEVSLAGWWLPGPEPTE
jgi:Uma2 family endonuclease